MRPAYGQDPGVNGHTGRVAQVYCSRNLHEFT